MERADDIFKRVIKKGEKAVDEFILTRKSEELFLDFKRSSDDGAGSVLSQNDKNNLAKAISGFGNSEGGILIWGVDCSKGFDGADVAKAKFPILKVQRFVSWLEGAVSGCTIPPHSGVRSHPIPIDRNGNGFAITYIPKSINTPHQMVGKFQYYIRAGSDFVPTPHHVLAGMFGRRPQPYVFSIVEPPSSISMKKKDSVIYTQANLLVCNDGPVVARDLFITAKVLSAPGIKSSVEFAALVELNTKDWNWKWDRWKYASMVGKPDISIAPKSYIEAIGLFMRLAPPFEEEIEIQVFTGCENAPLHRLIMKNKPKGIEKLYTKYITIDFNTLTFKQQYNFVLDLLKPKGT